jgi:hypothetical protein
MCSVLEVGRKNARREELREEKSKRFHHRRLREH